MRTLEASDPVFLVMNRWWCFDSKFHPQSELWRPVTQFFQGVWGSRFPGKVQFIKIPDISRPKANRAIYEVMVMFWLKISSKIRTLEAGGPIFSGGLGSKTSRQGSIHQNTQHKTSGGKSIFSKLMECEALLRNFIRLILEGKETIKRSFGMQRRDFVQNF